MINWGIIAPGKIAHKFAEGLRFVESANLMAVASRDLNRAKQFCDQYQCDTYYGNYDELFQNESIDAVYIASPHHLHFEHTIKALKHKKAVLCEKPFAINSKQVTEMIACAKEQKVFLMEALWTRFLPHIIKIKEHIDSNKYGEIEFIDSSFCFRANYDENSRLFNPKLGGGTLLDIGIYPIFLNYLLLGLPENMQASAIKAPTGVDQTLQCLFNYANQNARFVSSFKFNTPNEAKIYFKNGSLLKIDSQFHIPTNFRFYEDGLNESEVSHVEFVGNGYNYQVEEVNKCLLNGQIESNVWSWSNSLDLINLLDHVRELIDLKYEYDK